MTLLLDYLFTLTGTMNDNNWAMISINNWKSVAEYKTRLTMGWENSSVEMRLHINKAFHFVFLFSKC